MEHRLLHRWYGYDVEPHDHSPEFHRQSFADDHSDREIFAKHSLQQKSLVTSYKSQIANLVMQEKQTLRQLDLLDKETRTLPSGRGERTEDEEMRLNEIEAEWNIVQEDMRRIKEHQKFFYTLLNLFGVQ